jgi:hypothetical protein
MSTVKNPRDKKQLSLERDRRNRYGENSKSSRKSIQRGKQRRHMDERRTVGEVLGQLKGKIEEDVATEAELIAKTRIVDSRRRGFKKRPDTPSGSFWRRRRREKIGLADKSRMPSAGTFMPNRHTIISRKRSPICHPPPTIYPPLKMT